MHFGGPDYYSKLQAECDDGKVKAKQQPSEGSAFHRAMKRQQLMMLSNLNTLY